MKTKKTLALLALALLALVPMACSSEADGASQRAMEDPEPPANDGKIAIPAAVRRNLGITFVSPEKREVRATTYLAGVVEAPPEALSEHHALFRGRITWAVKRYQEVEAGALIAMLAPLDIASQQSQLLAAFDGEAQAQNAYDDEALHGVRLSAEEKGMNAALLKANAVLLTRNGHQSAQKNEVIVIEKRLAELAQLNQSAGGLANQIAATRIELAAKRTALAEVEEEIAETQLDISERSEAAKVKAHEVTASGKRLVMLAAAIERSKLHTLATKAAIAEHFGQARGWLIEAKDALAQLHDFAGFEIRAQSKSTLANLSVSDAALVDEGTLLCRLLDRTQLVIRAHQRQASLMTDLASLEAHAGLSSEEGEPLTGTLAAPLEAEAADRLADLIFIPSATPAWMRPGLSMRVAVQKRVEQSNSVAIPRDAIIQDGLDLIYFLRDHTNPDKVMRMVADIGAKDGRWVEIKSGLGTKDEVVLDGIYELKLASSASATKGGHFHADGTFHEAHD